MRPLQRPISLEQGHLRLYRSRCHRLLWSHSLAEPGNQHLFGLPNCKPHLERSKMRGVPHRILLQPPVHLLQDLPFRTGV